VSLYKSLIFCTVLYSVDMSERPDKLKVDRETMTGSAQADRQATCPPVRMRQSRSSRSSRSGDGEGTSFQTGAS
jgi:hypothetical protein